MLVISRNTDDKVLLDFTNFEEEEKQMLIYFSR